MEKKDIKFHHSKRGQNFFLNLPFEVSEMLHFGFCKMLTIFELLLESVSQCVYNYFEKCKR
jgi:hypothetical protein